MENLLKEIIETNRLYYGEERWWVEKFCHKDFGYIATIENEWGHSEEIAVDISDVFLFLYSNRSGNVHCWISGGNKIFGIERHQLASTARKGFKVIDKISGEPKVGSPASSSVLELLAWATSNLDCEALVCVCCDDKRQKIKKILTEANLINGVGLGEFRDATQSPNDQVQPEKTRKRL